MMENNKTNLPVSKVGRVNIRPLLAKDGVHYQLRIVIPKEMRRDGKREKTKIWTNEEQLKGKALRLKLEKEAIEFEKSVLQNSQGNNYQNMLLSDYIKHFRNVKVTAGVKHNTLLYYDNMAQRVNEYYRNVKITDITAANANDFLVWLKSQTSSIQQTARQRGNLKEFTTLYGVTQKAISDHANISIKTVEACYAGKNINSENAKKIYKAIFEIVNNKKHIIEINRIRANRKPAEPPLPIPNISFNHLFVVNEAAALSEKTIREHYVFLHAVLQLAFKEKIISYNPLDDTEKPKVNTGEKECFTADEIKSIIAILDCEVSQGKTSCKWQAVMYLLIFTGARRGEIMGLSWDSIDFNKGLMTIKQASSYSHERKEVYIHTPKTKQSIRTIMLSTRVINVLREYKKEYLQIKSKATKWVDTGLLFVQPDGRPISPGAIDDWMQSFAQRNGLPHMNPHKFRHSAATNMLRSNQIDLKSASVMLGHSTPSVTANIYAHALKDNNAKACGVLADVYSGEKNKNSG